jgi:hypothetical protein
MKGAKSLEVRIQYMDGAAETASENSIIGLHRATGCFNASIPFNVAAMFARTTARIHTAR